MSFSRKKKIQLERREKKSKTIGVWQLRLKITNDISGVLINFPKHERYDLSSQISRCSVSMPSNIAKGSGRTDKGFKNFIDCSLKRFF